MSSTNRGYDRHKSDYYVTPIDKIIDFLEAFAERESNAFNNGYILDPCAGGDEINPMSYPEALRRFGVTIPIKTIDIRADSLADEIGDYLSIEVTEKPKVIITNPPFSLAEPIIEKALAEVTDDGFVIMLLRLNFYGGQKRYNGFWQRVGLPKYTFVHHRRMSFTPDGKTDSIEYAHFVWQKGYRPEFTQLAVI